MSDISEPIRSLAYELIQGAMVDLLKPPKTELFQSDKARDWLNCNNLETFSFTWCCNVLGMAPETIRKGIFKMSKEELFYRRKKR